MKKNKKRVFGVIGLGRFGMTLARTLSELGYAPIVIDTFEEKIKEIREYTDHALVVDGCSKEALLEAGIAECDTVIVCIGEAIDVGILAVLNLVELGVPNVIAKAISAEQGKVLEKIGASVVYPEHDVATRLAKRLVSDSLLDYLELGDEDEITQVLAGEQLDGVKLIDSGIRRKWKVNVIAIIHNGKTETALDPEYVISADDMLIVIGKKVNIRKFTNGIVGFHKRIFFSAKSSNIMLIFIRVFYMKLALWRENRRPHHIGLSRKHKEISFHSHFTSINSISLIFENLRKAFI